MLEEESQKKKKKKIRRKIARDARIFLQISFGPWALGCAVALYKAQASSCSRSLPAPPHRTIDGSFNKSTPTTGKLNVAVEGPGERAEPKKILGKAKIVRTLRDIGAPGEISAGKNSVQRER